MSRRGRDLFSQNPSSEGHGIPDVVKVLYSLCQQVWPQDQKKFVFISIPKNVKITVQMRSFSHTSKIMLKLFQARTKTSRCTSWIQKRQRNQKPNCQHILDYRKSKIIPKNIYFSFFDYTKVFDYVDHKKLWKILKEMGISDNLTCLL